MKKVQFSNLTLIYKRKVDQFILFFSLALTIVPFKLLVDFKFHLYFSTFTLPKLKSANMNPNNAPLSNVSLSLENVKSGETLESTFELFIFCISKGEEKSYLLKSH
jgi:hypothetical protein